MMLRRRVSRLGVLGVSLALLSFGAGTGAVGCGGDDASPANPSPTPEDAAIVGEGGTTGEGGVKPADVTIDIVVPPSTVYVGETAQLVASQSKASDGTQLIFGWAFATVPQGSTLTGSSIQGSNELVSFVPDVAGDYTLTVTATAGATSAKKDITIKAVNAPVFFLRTVSGSSVQDVGYELHTVAMDGTGDHAVACRQSLFAQGVLGEAGAGLSTDAGADADAASEMLQLGFAGLFYMSIFADQALDWWEAPAGEASHAAFQNLLPLPDGGPDAATSHVSLVIATQDNTCQSPPIEARSFDGKSGDAVFQPKFSPDGRRVAFVEQRGGKPRLVTTAIDGSDAHDVASFCADGAAQCYALTFFPRRPQWLDETHIGWMRATSDQNNDQQVGWEVVVATDVPSAPVSRYMACNSGTMPLLFNFLRDGSLLTNMSSYKTGPENLLVLGRNAAGTCTLVRNLTGLTLDGTYARDFSISPDGTQVAYIHQKDPPPPPPPQAPCDSGLCIRPEFTQRQGGELYMVPLDGSKAPAPIGAPRSANYGPRWIASGNRLVWNGSVPPPAGFDSGIPADAGADAATINQFLEGGLPAINVIQPDGGGFVPVAVGDPTNGSYVLGGGNGGSCSCEGACKPECTTKSCGIAERRGSQAAAFWGTAFGLAFMIRRRRRPRS